MPIIASNVSCDPQSTGRARDRERARACLPDQDLEPRGGLHVLGQGVAISRPEEWHASQRIDERALDDARARDRFDSILDARPARGERQKAREADVAPCRRRNAPHEHHISRKLAEERREIRDPHLRPRERREHPVELISSRAKVFRKLGPFSVRDHANDGGTPARMQALLNVGVLCNGGGERRECVLYLSREHGE